jgi:hypothetical protein
MSHFSVLVVTNEPGEAALTTALQPFHEFECTGIDDAYVQTLDITDEIREEYLAAITRRSVAPEMTFQAYCEENGYAFLQDSEAPDLADVHKYRYGVVNAQGTVVALYRRANPQSKWDWWKLGGRFTGRLISKGWGLTGEPGLNTSAAAVDTCDQCRVGDLNLSAMQARRLRERHLAWQDAQVMDASKRHLLYDITPGMTETDYCGNVPALHTFAILDHEGWYEKGVMGWWGEVAQEREDWPQRFQDYLGLLLQHPEQYVAIVDCHI